MLLCWLQKWVPKIGSCEKRTKGWKWPVSKDRWYSRPSLPLMSSPIVTRFYTRHSRKQQVSSRGLRSWQIAKMGWVLEEDPTGATEQKELMCYEICKHKPVHKHFGRGISSEFWVILSIFQCFIRPIRAPRVVVRKRESLPRVKLWTRGTSVMSLY